MRYTLTWSGGGSVTVDGDTELMAAIHAAVVNGHDIVTVALVKPRWLVQWSGFCESHQKGFYTLDDAHAKMIDLNVRNCWASVKLVDTLGDTNG